jgi:hypothetical protein
MRVEGMQGLAIAKQPLTSKHIQQHAEAGLAFLEQVMPY